MRAAAQDLIQDDPSKDTKPVMDSAARLLSSSSTKPVPLKLELAPIDIDPEQDLRFLIVTKTTVVP